MQNLNLSSLGWQLNCHPNNVQRNHQALPVRSGGAFFAHCAVAEGSGLGGQSGLTGQGPQGKYGVRSTKQLLFTPYSVLRTGPTTADGPDSLSIDKPRLALGLPYED